jgi:hypothetical protein
MSDHERGNLAHSHFPSVFSDDTAVLLDFVILSLGIQKLRAPEVALRNLSLRHFIAPTPLLPVDIPAVVDLVGGFGVTIRPLDTSLFGRGLLFFTNSNISGQVEIHEKLKPQP